jgi:hypothetical protein
MILAILAMMSMMCVVFVGSRSYAAALMCVVERAVITTLAGGGINSFGSISGNNDGSGSNAGFNYPCGVAVDAHGNVFVAEESLLGIRKVTASGGTRIGPVTLHARVECGRSLRNLSVRG